MEEARRRDIYFSFFMFTADLRPNDAGYTEVLVRHLKALTEIGYTGFDVHIAPGPAHADHHAEVESYFSLRRAFDRAGFRDVKFTTNVGTTRSFDPTSPYEEQRRQALSYLKSRVDITSVLGGENTIMSGPFLYPYGVFPLTDDGEGIWSDALQDWMKPRYAAAASIFRELAQYSAEKRVKLAIEPVKNWETPGPTMVSEALDFLESADVPVCGLTIDTAQVVMESQGPAIFRNNVARAARQSRLNYVHISAPDRGAVRDSWIPWEIMLDEIEPVYSGPYLVEVFNAIPPFESSMRMTRRRFWRPGEDAPEMGVDSAYDVARAALRTLEEKIASHGRRSHS
ncbi:UNVERIFIED_ORG: sugar phosphate isomerase/epimerase [Rhizobium esperanzae]|uniref:Xylose isomerase domain-containing protein n=2 Tax=Rhizobium phaseoli TaxID=396 RepID=A0ABM6CLC4_9HYPH|nr:xylose isomerase domain-containing protein [Rhizobium phaseoli]KEC69955.1 xylose isomerase domain-containing protein [Rhizobium leguminosarum bv. phaseoli CCGM1]ANL88925.1 xylose isomerase domain-containing protein [Rhizobium phaseoli]ANL95434.1 xylose isomerase domain-containing protein [Rhizobium phaseoli]PDS29322.1 sugar phosphate isomerase/epimerase [Rhizobium phaseoli]